MCEGYWYFDIYKTFTAEQNEECLKLIDKIILDIDINSDYFSVEKTIEGVDKIGSFLRHIGICNTNQK